MQLKFTKEWFDKLILENGPEECGAGNPEYGVGLQKPETPGHLLWQLLHKHTTGTVVATIPSWHYEKEKPFFEAVAIEFIKILKEQNESKGI